MSKEIESTVDLIDISIINPVILLPESLSNPSTKAIAIYFDKVEASNDTENTYKSGLSR